jgi:hypothetical protein
VHPKLGDLPWGPLQVSIGDFRLQVILGSNLYFWIDAAARVGIVERSTGTS